MSEFSSEVKEDDTHNHCHGIPELKNNQSLFQSVFDLSSDAIFLQDIDGRILGANKGFSVLFGYDSQEIRSLQMLDLVDAKYQDVHQDAWQALHRDGRVSGRSYMTTKNGKRLSLELNQKKEGDLILSVARDITDLVNTQRILQLQDTRFRAFFVHSSIGMAIVSLSGKWLEVNPALCHMTGYTESELLDINFQQLTHPDDLDSGIAFIQNAHADNREFYRSEKRYRHKNGTYFWISLNSAVVRDTDRKPLYFVSQMENITARKKSEEELKRSEANLKSMFESANVFYILLDDQLKVMAFNQHFKNEYEAHTGIHVRAGMSILELTMPDKRAMVEAALKTVLETAQPVEYDTDYTDKEPARYLTATVTPVLNGGKTTGVCMAVLDVTERKTIELEKQKIINDLMQRNRDLEQFSHIVSHNLRGPVSTILGLNSLLNECATDAHQQFIIDGITASTEKLDGVISDLHAILQVKRELSEIKRTIDMAVVVENIKESINLLISDRNVTISCNFSAVREIVSVPSYITSIFYNLITNSIKFAHPDRPPVINISSELADGRINLYFQDNGIGLDLKKYGNKVFRLYDRFHHHIDGKGLGLFMTKTQVEVLDGTIEITSEPGNGCAFKISFVE